MKKTKFSVTTTSFKSSSKILSCNMIKNKICPPCSTCAAHHIVAEYSPLASEARKILQRNGIGINDAENGVFLCTNRNMFRGNFVRAYHPALHTKEYYTKVNHELKVAESKAAELCAAKSYTGELCAAILRQAVIDALDKIRKQLLNNTF